MSISLLQISHNNTEVFFIRFENLNKSFGDNHVLKDINLYKHFECKKIIDKVFVADIKEYMHWENRSFFSLNEKDLAIHQPFFTYINDDASYVLFDSEVEGYDIQPAKEITDKLQIKSLTEKGFIAYNIMNNGKIVFVKYTDGTCSSYVIPYEQ